MVSMVMKIGTAPDRSVVRPDEVKSGECYDVLLLKSIPIDKEETAPASNVVAFQQ